MRAEHHEVRDDLSTGSINVIDDDGLFIARLTVIRTNPKGQDVNNYYKYLHRICEGFLAQFNAGRPHLTWEQYTGDVPAIGQHFRHFKGNLYVVTGYGVCSETRAAKVFYRPVPVKDGMTAEDRPLDMWFEVIDDKGTTRFTLEEK